MKTFERGDGITAWTDGAVEVAYSGTLLGNVDADPRFGPPTEACANLARLKHTVGVGRHALIAAQHGIEIDDITGPAATGEGETRHFVDGIFTDIPDVALRLHPADCETMGFYGGNNESVVGLVHAGWRGAHEGTHLEALRHMVKHYGISLADIRIFFGPSIRPDSYYFEQPEQLGEPAWRDHIEQRGEHYHIDVLSKIMADLRRERVDDSQWYVTPIDTGSDLNYFSHARAKRQRVMEGRNGVIARILPELVAA